MKPLKPLEPRSPGMRIGPFTSSGRWLQGVAIATLLHVAIAAPLALSMNAGAPPSLPSEAPLALDLAAIVAALPTPPSDQPVTAKPQETAPPAPPTPPVPTPRKMQVSEPLALATPSVVDPTPAVEPEAVPHEPKARPQASDNTALPSPPATHEAAPTAPVLGNANRPSESPALTWEARVLSLLERQKRYPPAARWQRQEDTVYLQLLLGRDGAVKKASILRSQGYEALDAEVIDLIRRVGAMPAPPPEVEGDAVALTIPVEFYIKGK